MKKLILILFVYFINVDNFKAQPSDSIPHLEEFSTVLAELTWHLGNNCLEGIDTASFPSLTHFNIYLQNCLFALVSNNQITINDQETFLALIANVYIIWIQLLNANNFDTEEEQENFANQLADLVMNNIYAHNSWILAENNICEHNCKGKYIRECALWIAGCAASGGPACLLGFYGIINAMIDLDICLRECRK